MAAWLWKWSPFHSCPCSPLWQGGVGDGVDIYGVSTMTQESQIYAYHTLQKKLTLVSQMIESYNMNWVMNHSDFY